MTPFITHKRVEFAETDMAGMVHFSNFFRYMEFAEQEFRRSRGLSVAWVEGETRYGFPRVSATCDYLVPARFEQVLEITVTVEKIGTKSIALGFEFRHGDTVIARGRVTSVCCQALPGGRMKSLPIPEIMRKKLLDEPT